MYIVDIPAEVDTYRNLFPLEPPPDSPHHKSKTFGYPTTCYKALNTKDGQTYCLRRIHGKHLHTHTHRKLLVTKKIRQIVSPRANLFPQKTLI